MAQIKTTTQMTFNCSPESIFDFITDTNRFPQAFQGFGLIPAVQSSDVQGPLKVGAIRRIHNSDKSVLNEEITVLDRPSRHCYNLSGFISPFALLVKVGRADWSIQKSAHGSGTEVVWSYDFTLTSPLIYPMAALVVQYFMNQAMARCLNNMKNILEKSSSHSDPHRSAV